MKTNKKCIDNGCDFGNAIKQIIYTLIGKKYFCKNCGRLFDDGL
jgi:hypothetical protein